MLGLPSYDGYTTDYHTNIGHVPIQMKQSYLKDINCPKT